MASHVPAIVLPGPVAVGEEVVPSREQLHYLRRVRRLADGAVLRGLSPDGRAVLLRLRAMPRGQARLVVVGEEPSRVEGGAVTVALALIKRMVHLDFVVEKGTEVGAAGWWAVLTERCADVGLERPYAHRMVRWRKIAEAAALQCGRTTVPEVRGVLRWPQFLEEASPFASRLVAMPDAPPLPHRCEEPILLLVGPEGGWSPTERRDLEAKGFTPVSFGPTVLRSETAALVGVVLLVHACASRTPATEISGPQ